ncbi:hypothetical protein ZEAMMB73_Zm00001d030503 [Zea mays]|uniref:Uncharacterized protein n=1 Tax=Zea mays TaxID=4577 RepID=A0A1D6KCK6_MAIZE|nr:hypothetical protein ZEAMMB73_Zm00001d030503 [Zea mays]
MPYRSIALPCPFHGCALVSGELEGGKPLRLRKAPTRANLLRSSPSPRPQARSSLKRQARHHRGAAKPSGATPPPSTLGSQGRHQPPECSIAAATIRREERVSDGLENMSSNNVKKVVDGAVRASKVINCDNMAKLLVSDEL